MFDWRWMMTQKLLKTLHKIGKGNGRFVFAVAGRPEPGRVMVEVADTTAIPGGKPVEDLIDIIVRAHAEAVRALFERAVSEVVPDALAEALRTDTNLPERSWKTDQVGEA